MVAIPAVRRLQAEAPINPDRKQAYFVNDQPLGYKIVGKGGWHAACCSRLPRAPCRSTPCWPPVQRPLNRMDVNAMGNGKWMTYVELGELIGGTPEAGRQLALRLKLRKQIGNEDKRVRVWVEEDTLPRRANRSTPVQTPVDYPVQTPVQEIERTGETSTLKAHLETLERLLVQQRNDHTADVDRLRDDLDCARRDADQWRDNSNREHQRADVLFDQVKDLTERLDQLHRDRQADVNRLRTALEDARRPWWRRLTGR